MKITVSIEVSNVEELSQVAEALKNGGLEIEGATDSNEEVETNEAPTRKPSKKAGPKKKAEVEIPATVANVPAPTEALVQNNVQIPPVIPAQAPAPQAPVSGQAIPGFDAVAMIQDAASRLGAFQGLDQAGKQDVIASTLAQIGAPQGIRGSELPEPHLSRFAQALSQRVNQITQGPLV